MTTVKEFGNLGCPRCGSKADSENLAVEYLQREEYTIYLIGDELHAGAMLDTIISLGVMDGSEVLVCHSCGFKEPASGYRAEGVW